MPQATRQSDPSAAEECQCFLSAGQKCSADRRIQGVVIFHDFSVAFCSSIPICKCNVQESLG